MMLANYADQHSFAPSAHLERLLLAVPFTAALTIPVALFLAVAWVSRQLRRATGSRVMPRGLRRSVLVVASGMAAFMLVLTSEIVPRANLQLQSVQLGRQARRNDRSMTIMELQQAAASLRTGVNPSSSTQQARDLRAQEVSYRVEIQKKLVLAASCLVLALAALALGWHFARVNAAVLVAAGITLCVLFVVSVMAGEALAESLVVPPIIAMWAGTELVLLMTLPALRSKRAVA
jgi:lipopolysaccharide export LptBFGC system permease protein LptF